MQTDTFIVWSSKGDDPARAQLAAARAAIVAAPGLTIIDESGSAKAPSHLLVAGKEGALRTLLTAFSDVHVEANQPMNLLRGEYG